MCGPPCADTCYSGLVARVGITTCTSSGVNWVTPYLRGGRMPLLRYGVASACEWARLHVFDPMGCENLIISMLCNRGQCQVLLYWCAGSRRTGAHVWVRCAQGDTSAGVWIVAAVPCKQGASGRQVEIYTLLCRCYTTSGGVRVCKRHRVHECVCASTGWRFPGW